MLVKGSYIEAVWSQPPGSQLTAPGSYLDDIETLTAHYPILRSDERDCNRVRLQRPSRTVVYSFDDLIARNEPLAQASFSDALALGQHLDDLEKADESQNTKTLVILEGQQPEFVSVLGSQWRVEPEIFHRHRINDREHMGYQGANTILLAHMVDPERRLSIHYPELRYFLRGFESDTMRTADTYRNIATTDIGSFRDNTGVVDVRASYWSRPLSGGGWQALLIVDPKVTGVLVGRGEEAELDYPQNEPFQGGYPDPIPYSSLDAALSTPPPPRRSMFDDLNHYFNNHHHLLDYTTPTCTTYFLKLIAACHFSHVYNYTRGLFDQMEYELDRRQNFAMRQPEATLQPFWSDLHHFRRRIEYYTRHLASITLQLGLDELQRGQFPTQSIHPMDKNFLFIQRQFLDLDARTGAIFQAYGVLAGITCSQQSVSESRAAQSIQYLAVIFLPISFAASIFSMGGDYIAGGSHFWVFVVVALVSILIVTMTAAAIRVDWRKRIYKHIELDDQRLLGLKIRSRSSD